MQKTIVLLAILAAGAAGAQETATPNDVRDVRAHAYALTGGTVHVDPDTTLEGATLLIREGEIVAVRAAGVTPPGYVVVDAGGRHVYPGLIDLYSSYGLPEPEKPAPFSFSAAEVLDSQKPGAFNVNQAIRAEYRAVTHFTADQEKAKALRKLGFGAVLTHMADGIARGTGALVATGEGSDNELVIVPEAAAHFSLNKGSSPQSYPISPMGSMALLRQTYLDAEWYGAQNPKPFADRSLEALLATRALPQIFEARDWLSLLRADSVGDEFGLQYLIKGGGDEYRRIEAVKQSGAALIVAVDFPKPPDVADPWEARTVSLADMKHWELAPGNPAALAAADIPFALTSAGNAENFWSNLRAAIERGLGESRALAGLTTRPASLLGLSDRLGALKAGAIANLLITSKPLFDEGSVIEENWVQGKRFVLSPHPSDYRGRYELSVGGDSYELSVTGEPRKPEGSIPAPAAEPASDEDGGDDDQKKPDEEKIKVELTFDNELVALRFSPAKDAPPLRLNGWITADRWQGRGQLGDGTWVAWSARRLPESDEAIEPEAETQDEDEAAAEAPGPITYPFAPYGWTEKPAAEPLLFTNATVWTLEDEGVIEGGDVLVRDGRIAAVGRGLAGDGARVIDAGGMHLTPGIIDEHAHIALSGVNDVATNSGMVRMADVVDSEDVNIYRNLAGGVTAAQLLHGSANPIGGQSALVKMRWGALPREMLIDGADGFIKFALGENVKRSRNNASIRYPQSRMGVEQVFRDALTAARDYQARRAAYEALSRRERSRTPPPRRDLALDAMVEILESERFITCHSYVQSEINMLMKVAEDFGFRVNTFTHILEGYKVADLMAKHGAGASAFADWWAYKWEVRYAIPYNPVLMSEAGVTVAINSDSREMSRRLNQEAAKAIKYGGMSEVEALKLVTLNPARLLHLEDRMGSIRAGKDADLVLWTDHPLSIAARPEKTLVDGAIYFDAARDRALRTQIRAERARLIAKLAKAKGKGDGAKGPGGMPPRVWQCDSLHGYEYLDVTEVGS